MKIKTIPVVMKTCFSEEKLIKKFGTSALREPPFELLLPPIYEQIFHEFPLCPNFKNKKPPTLILAGEESS